MGKVDPKIGIIISDRFYYERCSIYNRFRLVVFIDTIVKDT